MLEGVEPNPTTAAVTLAVRASGPGLAATVYVKCPLPWKKPAFPTWIMLGLAVSGPTHEQFRLSETVTCTGVVPPVEEYSALCGLNVIRQGGFCAEAQIDSPRVRPANLASEVVIMELTLSDCIWKVDTISF